MPSEPQYPCAFCRDPIDIWFRPHGPVICEECGKKGLTRRDLVPSVLEVLKEKEPSDYTKDG